MIDVSLAMCRVRDPGGEVLAISTIGRDITERKRFEAELRGSPTTTRSRACSTAAASQEELSASPSAPLRRRAARC